MPSDNDDRTELIDGQIELIVRNLRGAELRRVKADLWLLKIIGEECEDKHGLKSVDGMMRGTAEFFVDLAQRFTACGALSDCSPSLAAQAWKETHAIFAGLKKSTNETPNSPIGSDLIPGV